MRPVVLLCERCREHSEWPKGFMSWTGRVTKVCTRCTTNSANAHRDRRVAMGAIPRGRTMCIECRFWSKVTVAGPDECWVWTAGKIGNGYGEFRSPVGAVAHRYAWVLAGNLLLPTDCVLHSCDNPPCVNPAHLRVGTHEENMRDAVNRGRCVRGERSNKAKLTEAAIVEIRSRHAAGESQSALAREFGVGSVSVHRIVRRTSWKHVPSVVP